MACWEELASGAVAATVAAVAWPAWSFVVRPGAGGSKEVARELTVAQDVAAERQVAAGGCCRSGKYVASGAVAAGLGAAWFGSLTTGTGVVVASVAVVAAAAGPAPSWRRMCF